MTIRMSKLYFLQLILIFNFSKIVGQNNVKEWNMILKMQLIWGFYPTNYNQCLICPYSTHEFVSNFLCFC